MGDDGMPDSLALVQHALLFTFETSLVLVLAAACTGVAVSVMLSAFQIQDQTLPFLLKLVVVSVTLAATWHTIGKRMLDIVEQVFALIVTTGA
jgi:type III secretion protein S